MSQLHELLAVEPSLKKNAQAIILEALNTFKKKETFFFGQIRRYQPNYDDGIEFPAEDKPLAAKVFEKIDYAGNAWGKYVDALLQKEQTNTKAKALLKIGDKEFELSATALLSLETTLNALKPILLTVPTLPNGIDWRKPEGKGQNYWESSPVDTIKMKKINKPLVLAPATKEHPSQVQLVTEDVPIGTWTTTQISTAITSEEKAEMLGRLDDLIREVKKARSRANKQEVEKLKIGKDIFKYIVGS